MGEVLRKTRVLICDDSSIHRIALQNMLKQNFQCVTAKNADEAVGILKSQFIDLLFLDISMRSNTEGLEYLPRLRNEFPELGIIISSHHSSFDFVRQALTGGADDYLPKSASFDDISLSITRVLKIRELHKQSKRKENEIKRHFGQVTFLGNSKFTVDLRSKIKKLQASDVNVIIYGESGTGKELVARSLRKIDQNGNYESFVAVDSSTIQGSMAESLLFGHEKGAFTGADKSRAGLFEEADGGVIYFDEISNMPIEIQRKLLRVIQEKEVTRLGSTQVRKLSFRVICATNQNLEELVDKGLFQFDLLHRLSVVNLNVLPLRQRSEDIPLLIKHFMDSQSGATKFELSAELQHFLKNYPWHGNVRELNNTLAFLLTMSDGPLIELEDLPEKFFKKSKIANRPDLPSLKESSVGVEELFEKNYQQSIKNFEREFMIQAYKKSGMKISQMARDISLDRSYLYSKLKSLDLFPVVKLKDCCQ